MNESKNKDNHSFFNYSEINRETIPRKSSDQSDLIEYKEIFKSFIKFKKYNSFNRKYISEMYIQSRDRYQKYVTNKNNSLGLRLEGNKNYQNLPLNIFQDDYVTNTNNISKELENESLRYFKPLSKRELSIKKIIEGEKIKLTPIPFKKKDFINNKEEIKKIQEIKRSTVFMRKIEYTHLIKNLNSKNKNDKEKDLKKLAEKIYILKGAILIIEDWWKKIKLQRKKRKEEEEKRLDKNNLYYINMNGNLKENNINNNFNEKIQKNKYLLNDINQMLKLNENNNFKKANLNNNEKIIKNSKRTSNKNKIINDKGTNKNFSGSNISTNHGSSETIKEKIYHDLNSGNNNKEQIYKKTLNIYKSKDFNKKLIKNKSLRSNYNKINNFKVNNLIKKKYTTESVYQSTDIEKFYNSMNSSQTKTNQSYVKVNNKKEGELFIKTNNVDIDIKNTKLNRDIMQISENNNNNNNKKDNNSVSLDLKNKSNSTNHDEIGLLIDKKKMNYIKNNNKVNKENDNNKNVLFKNNKKNKQISIKKIHVDFNGHNDKDDSKSFKIKEKISSEDNKNKKDESENKLNKNNLNKENDKISKLMKENRIYFNNNNNQPIKDIEKNENITQNEKQEKIQKYKKMYKSQAFSFEIEKDLKEKKFNNLKISSINEISFSNNKISISQKIDSVKKDFEYEIINSKKEFDLNETDELYKQNKVISITNNHSNNKKNNNSMYEDNGYMKNKNQLERNTTNNPIEDSEIIPLEPDTQKNFIKEVINKETVFKNENKDKLKINIISQKRKESCGEKKNNSIEINILKGNRAKYETNNYNNIWIQEVKNKFVCSENNLCNNTFYGVPKHIKEIYKLYRNKSTKDIKNKKHKKFEFLRTLHSKFEYE